MGYRDDAAVGAGIATYDGQGRVLDAWFPAPALGDVDPAPVDAPTGTDQVRGTSTEHVTVRIASLAQAPADTLDVWLRLHLLSHRLIRPHEANLDGIFGFLTNVAWTSVGPIAAEELDEARLRARRAGVLLHVHGVDKFPRMTDYVMPTGVRIADADRVRLGAYLSSGTTVMHEGFVNFNAGTLGTSMVEGRISQGVVVGDGTDVGGGSSIQGTLSGGGTIVVSLGERCLLGANSGIGIPLGDDCVVAAGCYVTAGSKVTLPDGSVVRARELAGINDTMFWTNTQTGVLEARPRTGKWTGLNEALHAN
ncbi:MAG TPA: 2,3,4,5-tetrahydropyridine-2,6-dicarboxylate N-succinyltransferase [Mycobacteriales bacterium]|nr:2,3,4,5-tetrahydropyridine-2,6-dicarboxylate N-succinyltransferase [Mycobacteriales bacterium]